MAPNKFEKHIKQRLEEREIRPSINAWSRISEQLEGGESPKTNTVFRYAIAASFIGFLVVSIWYFNRDAPVDSQNTVVESAPVDSSIKEEKSDKTFEQSLEKESIVAKRDKIPNKNDAVDSPEIPNNNPKISVVMADKGNEPLEKVILASEGSCELIDIKIAEIIAQVDLLEKENNSITDAEIDTLLRQAQQEILEDKIFRQDRSVDATALLADVEDELDKSFRDQIFDALKDGFVKVRTAVADRNK